MQSALGILRMLLYCAGCELDDKRCVIRLNFRLVRCLISHNSAASIASMNDNVALLRIRLCADRAENTAAIVGSVTGVDIHVERAEAEWAMIS